MPSAGIDDNADHESQKTSSLLELEHSPSRYRGKVPLCPVLSGSSNCRPATDSRN